MFFVLQARCKYSILVFKQFMHEVTVHQKLQQTSNFALTFFRFLVKFYFMNHDVMFNSSLLTW